MTTSAEKAKAAAEEAVDAADAATGKWAGSAAGVWEVEWQDGTETSAVGPGRCCPSRHRPPTRILYPRCLRQMASYHVDRFELGLVK